METKNFTLTHTVDNQQMLVFPFFEFTITRRVELDLPNASDVRVRSNEEQVSLVLSERLLLRLEQHDSQMNRPQASPVHAMFPMAIDRFVPEGPLAPQQCVLQGCHVEFSE